MRLTYKYRLYPTQPQIEFLNTQLREACDLYNCALQERRDAWKTCRKSLSLNEQCAELPAMRADGCLTLVNAQATQDVLRRLDKTFRSFFSRVKQGKKPGYPRYKTPQRYNSLTYPQYPSGCRLLLNGTLHVQGTGAIKLKLHRPINGAVKTATIKREADRWFVCFSAECEITPSSNTSQASVGIDLGLSRFAAQSDGKQTENPRYYRKAQKKLRMASRKVARRKKGSNRRRKAVLLLQKAHLHVINQRNDFHHKESRKLVNAYGTIAVEDLNIKGMARGLHPKSVYDAGWTSFINMLAYKAESAGRKLIKVDPRRTSQICVCGASVPKALDDRWHHCPTCGLSADRDHVSARIILQRAGNQPSGANVEEVVSCVS